MAVADPRVLIVEDDDALRALLKAVLSLDEFSVTGVRDGLDALNWLEIETPDLVILDLALPIVDGLAVAQEISARADTREIPVLIVTGSDRPLPKTRATCSESRSPPITWSPWCGGACGNRRLTGRMPSGDRRLHALHP